MNFVDYTLKDATQAVADTVLSWQPINAKYIGGDHWQDANGWVGPLPADTATRDLIKKAFVSKNVILEIVSRHAAGVIGSEPDWSFTVQRPLADGEQPNPAEQALIDEAEAVLTTWWDGRKIHARIKDAAQALLWAGAAVLRLYVPSGLLDGAEVPRADLGASLGRIYLSLPTYEQAAIVTDDATEQQCGVFVYERDKEKRGELSFLDEAGLTVVRRFAGEAVENAEPLDLGQRLTMAGMLRAALVSEQIRQLQAQLNMTLTMMGRNAVQGGFLERILFNVQTPGEWVDATQGEAGAVQQSDGTYRKFVPGAMKVGPGTTNVFQGATYVDENGATHALPPSVSYRDPVAPDTFIASKNEYYRSILEEVQQLHALIAGDAMASGESRKQARADFETSLRDTQTEIESVVRWLLETALAMAAAFAGQPGRFNELRAVVACRINTGPVTSEDQADARDNYAAKLWSRDTAIAATGLPDVDAEIARIEAESAAATPPALAAFTGVAPTQTAATVQQTEEVAA